ncbi:glycosyltransferase family 2 protein [Rhodopirellula sp. JC639]|uniref:glycosyltransferase family 2 protein n=1 Tax=Stieleria mannarensis TaxID=2755585 RepID=UPI0015FF43D0|nr:glycosyltransferase family 2 protein [Rhodopirellula sp. JC639]
MPELSVIISVYNERGTIEQVLSQFPKSGLSDYELIVVDDGSSDGTTEFLKAHQDKRTRVILRSQNGGKTSAVRAGLEHATGKSRAEALKSLEMRKRSICPGVASWPGRPATAFHQSEDSSERCGVVAAVAVSACQHYGMRDQRNGAADIDHHRSPKSRFVFVA